MQNETYQIRGCIHESGKTLQPGRNAATRKGLEMVRVARVINVENYQGFRRNGARVKPHRKPVKTCLFCIQKGAYKPEKGAYKDATLQRNQVQRVATNNGGDKAFY